MLKKFITFIIILSICGAVFADGVQSKAERVKAIDDEINQLMKRKTELEHLKASIQQNEYTPQKKTDLTKKRPKIALVLSGGGAKGAAHIGVLKILEKNKIPIDMIVGTSIGSIVGAMYSVGYSPSEIEGFMTTTDFTKLMTNSKDRKYQDAQTRDSFERYPLTLNIDRDLNLSLPKGVLKSQNIYFLLKSKFNRANKIKDFDKMPIQFRAITTDLQSGKEVVLDKGDIALSVLKSMSLPSIFDPVEDNGHFYVDGGVTNNFPIDVAVHMGADIIIAVDITTDSIDINDKSNILSVLMKLSTYNGDRNTEFQKKLASILITPDVKDHSTIDFSNMGKLVDIGEKEAAKYEDTLKNMSDPLSFHAMKDKMLHDGSVEIDNVELSGNDALTLDKVLSLRPSKERVLTAEEIDIWAKKIYAITYIDLVNYEINGNTIAFKVKEKNDFNIKASLGFTSKYGGSLEVLASIPHYGKFTRNHIIKGEISSYPKIGIGSTAFYDFGRVSVGSLFNIGYETDPLFVYKKGDNISTYKSSSFVANLRLATAIFKNTLVGIDTSYKKTRNLYSSGTRDDSYFKKNRSDLTNTAFLIFDTLDKKAFPSKGIFFYSDFKKSYTDDYYGFDASADIYYPINDKFSVSIGGSTGRMFGDKKPVDEMPRLGGIHNGAKEVAFFGLPTMGKYVERYHIVRGGIQYKVSNSFNLLGKYNIAAYDSGKTSFQEERKIKDGVITGYGIGVGWDTFAGPLTVYVTNNHERKKSPLIEVRIGYTF